jgi:DNA-binding NtrC family response regulator
MGVEVLFVDDDPAIRDMMNVFFTLWNVKFRLASSAYEAISFMSDKGNSVRMLITDICMPGMDGYELARKCRRDYPAVQIVAITGNVKPDKDSSFLFDNVVVKPTGFEALEEIVNRCIAKPRISKQLASLERL